MDSPFIKIESAITASGAEMMIESSLALPIKGVFFTMVGVLKTTLAWSASRGDFFLNPSPAYVCFYNF